MGFWFEFWIFGFNFGPGYLIFGFLALILDFWFEFWTWLFNFWVFGFNSGLLVLISVFWFYFWVFGLIWDLLEVGFPLRLRGDNKFRTERTKKAK